MIDVLQHHQEMAMLKDLSFLFDLQGFITPSPLRVCCVSIIRRERRYYLNLQDQSLPVCVVIHSTCLVLSRARAPTKPSNRSSPSKNVLLESGSFTPNTTNSEMLPPLPSQSRLRLLKTTVDHLISSSFDCCYAAASAGAVNIYPTAFSRTLLNASTRPGVVRSAVWWLPSGLRDRDAGGFFPPSSPATVLLGDITAPLPA